MPVRVGDEDADAGVLQRHALERRDLVTCLRRVDVALVVDGKSGYDGRARDGDVLPVEQGHRGVGGPIAIACGDEEQRGGEGKRPWERGPWHADVSMGWWKHRCSALS
jgi:hypothetical protein